MKSFLFSFDPNIKRSPPLPKNLRLFPAQTFSVSISRILRAKLSVSFPPLQFSFTRLFSFSSPLFQGRLICDRCQNLNSYSPFEHYYALLLPEATRRSLCFQCIRRPVYNADRHECHDRDEQWALPMRFSVPLRQAKNFLACFRDKSRIRRSVS